MFTALDLLTVVSAVFALTTMISVQRVNSRSGGTGSSAAPTCPDRERKESGLVDQTHQGERLEAVLLEIR
jgi:hypothetical protein